MDWIRFRAALIRGFWTIIFPLIGTGVVWASGNLDKLGVTNGAAILVIGGVLYGLKKMLWPNTVL